MRKEKRREHVAPFFTESMCTDVRQLRTGTKA